MTLTLVSQGLHYKEKSHGTQMTRNYFLSILKTGGLLLIMKWFKHMSDMLDDPIVSAVMVKFKDKGYSVINGVFELYAKYCRDKPGLEVHIPWKKIEDSLYLKRATVIKVMNEYVSVESRLKLDRDAAELLQFSSNDLELILRIPKMKALKDEWTSRKNQKLGSCSGVTPAKKKKEEVDKDKEKTHKKETTTEPKVCVSINSELSMSCQASFRKVSGLSDEQTRWVLGFIDMTTEELRKNRPELDDNTIKSCWQSACEQSVARNAVSPLYYQKVFHALIAQTCTPERPKPGHGGTGSNKKAEQDALAGRIQALLEAPMITSFWGETHSTHDLVYEPNNRMYPIQSTSGDGFRIDNPRHWEPVAMKLEA